MKELTKDDMYAVEVRGGLEREEELAAVGVRPGVGHGEEARLVVRNAEVFVREGRACKKGGRVGGREGGREGGRGGGGEGM